MKILDAREFSKYLHLLSITMNGMLATLIFFFYRLSSGVVYLCRNEASVREVAGFLAVADVTLILLAVLATVAIAHSEYGIPYKPLYFLFGLPLINLSLFISMECVYASVFLMERNLEGLSVFRVGMFSLVFTFAVLVLYLFRVAVGDIPKGLRKKKILIIGVFHVFGGVLAALTAFKPGLALPTSIAGLVVSLVFLFGFWAVRIDARI